MTRMLLAAENPKLFLSRGKDQSFCRGIHLGEEVVYLGYDGLLYQL